MYPIHYSFLVGKFFFFKGIVLDWFITWIQTSLLKALRDSALANIVPGLSQTFNGHKNVDGFDDFGRVFLTINVEQTSRANVPQHSLSIKDLPIGDYTGI